MKTHIPIGVSNRHVHLTKEHFEQLFGPARALTVLKPLSQPGQFAANETVDVSTPKGTLKNVRILGPYRRESQIELARTDAYALGITPPVRMSGDTKGSGGATIIGPQGSIVLEEGVIIAQRHVHFSLEDAAEFGVKDGDWLTLLVETSYAPEKMRSERRDVVLTGVTVRVSERYKLDCHLDTDEANAACVSTGGTATVLERHSCKRHPRKPSAFKPAQKKLITEADILAASQQGKTIDPPPGALLTPAARTLGQRLGVLR